jgi:glutathione synthase/RimK-type ligase-like ATP-grasp enzyme
MIILLSHSQDFYTIDLVMEHLQSLGADFVRLNTDALPFFHPLSGNFSPGQPGRVTIEFQNGPFHFQPEDVAAVWNRRLWPGRLPPDFPPEAGRRCAPAARAAVTDLLGLFGQARWINPLAAAERAESKVLQLHLAARLGLRLPDTLVSNNPRDVEAFYHHHQGEIITKLLVPAAVSMEAHPDFVYTCRVTAEHLPMLEHVRAQPQIYQPFLRKVREYRAVAVGRKFLVGALRVPEEGPLSVDWRQATEEDELRWEEATLPAALEEKLLSLMDALGLSFGVFDLVDTGEGELTFLEVNQGGEWGMLQRDLELPIAQAIARELVGP